MKIKNEKQLIEKLKQDILETDKKIIVILAGHFPLIYKRKGAVEAIYKWGKFSTYSLELGCMAGKYAKEIGKEVKFLFLVDDHAYEELGEIRGTPMQRRRKQLYRNKSMKDAKLPEKYEKIMRKYGFSEKDVLRHNHKKKGRENCLYFSEKILRKYREDVENQCAREYVVLLEDEKYFNKKEDYLLAFIPNRCKNNICEFALDSGVKELSTSHIFIETMNPLSTIKELYEKGKGISYRKD